MRSPKMLTEELRLILPDFMAEVTRAGINIMITSTLRTIDEQRALFAQGRHDLDTVNELRSIAGLWAITEKENAHCVTWTMRSNHMAGPDGLAWAFDFACLDRRFRPHWNEKYDVDNDEIPDYTEVGVIGEKFGLEWGGRWEKPDYPHLQLAINKERSSRIRKYASLPTTK